MTIYPVVMCGGSGTRLWPASTRARPKQFVPLSGEKSSFQNTILRVSGIPEAAGPIVVAGVTHRDLISSELRVLGIEATLLLEPEARDSAAAMAAAAAWIAQNDSEGIAVFVSADHEIPDSAAFHDAVVQAAEAASHGHIVTLGVMPTFPSTAFGYIKPGEGSDQVRPVAAFVEKPDLDRAQAYLSEGYLWNSGNFVVAASVLIEELKSYAPDVASAATEAAATATITEGTAVLGEAFRGAPKISIDYAVMEKTRQAAVLPVGFEWADIGAWDALLKIAAKDQMGNSAGPDSLLIEVEGCLVRAPADYQVAVIGVRDLAVVIHDNAVLVAGLAHTQAVKKAGEHFSAPAANRAGFSDLREAKGWLTGWLETRALPLWWSLGADHATGGFIEALDGGARPVEPMRRARVAARQAVVYATAGIAGWSGPWRATVDHGLAALQSTFRRPDGLYRTKVSPSGVPVDEDAYLYDQAFVLLALAKAHQAGLGAREEEALGLLARLEAFRRPEGGFREAGANPYQSNAHMHLLEAALAWVEAGASSVWLALADEIVRLALGRFIDARGGFLREFFDETWAPAAGSAGRRVEPGHQFEWLWLFEQYRLQGGQEPVAETMARLYEAGVAGFDPSRGVAVDALDDALGVMEGSARLWPQTEFLRAALVMQKPEHALKAATAIRLYLDKPSVGQWLDQMTASGGLLAGPSPASSLYHLSGAFRALASMV